MEYSLKACIVQADVRLRNELPAEHEQAKPHQIDWCNVQNLLLTWEKEEGLWPQLKEACLSDQTLHISPLVWAPQKCSLPILLGVTDGKCQIALGSQLSHGVSSPPS